MERFNDKQRYIKEHAPEILPVVADEASLREYVSDLHEDTFPSRRGSEETADHVLEMARTRIYRFEKRENTLPGETKDIVLGLPTH